MKKWFVSILLILSGFALAMAAGWSPQLASSQVNSIGGQSGPFNVGGGLLVTNNGGPNFINQVTGNANVIRNATFTSFLHQQFLYGDFASGCCAINIASLTGSIATTVLTVTGSPTGTIQIWQRLTDAVNFTTNAPTAINNTVLFFPSTTGIVAGEYAYDVTNPTAILGGVTVASTTGTTVTLTTPGSYPRAVQNPGVSSGDVIAFSKIAPGTQIIGNATFGANLCSPACTGTGGAGTYAINVSQTVSPGETMTSAGGWSADGVYIIPVGSAGTTVFCGETLPLPAGAFGAGGGITCSGATANLTDLIARFPLDSVDSIRVVCPLYGPGLGMGQNMACTNGGPGLGSDQPPVTFHIHVTYPSMNTLQPALDTRLTCPAIVNQGCIDQWTQATTDLVKVNLQTCTTVDATPFSCDLAYSWYPGGAFGMELNFHFGAIQMGQTLRITNVDFRQTPGATCNGTPLTAPPFDTPPPTGCLQNNPPPFEIPEVVSDINHNRRFTQTFGTGAGAGYNPGSLGPIKTKMTAAWNTTQVFWEWPLPVGMRCNTWVIGAKSAPSCPPPNVYFSWGHTGTVADLQFVTAAGSFSASAVAVNLIEPDSVQLFGTFSGLTANTPGFIRIGGSNGDMFLVDSSVIGD